MCIRDRHKHYRKDWTGENLDLVMAEWDNKSEIQEEQPAEAEA